MSVAYVMHTPSGGRTHFRRVVMIGARPTLMWAPPSPMALHVVRW